MILPQATETYERRDQDQLRRATELAVTTLEQKPNIALISGDRGDASVTINAGTDFEIQRFATVLTANRTVTLGTGYAGAKFTIVRSGLGAFTLDIGPGLKTLIAATAAWADMGHTGSAWILLRDGTL